MPDPRRALPRTDILLADPRLQAAVARVGREPVKAAVVKALQEARSGQLPIGEIADRATALVPPRATRLQPVINATGVVLHTNLGRAPLSEAAVAAITAAAGYVDVEFDLGAGARAQRGRHTLAALASAVPAAEAVLVVNNGAAALLLAVTALAAGREAVVSRGELVEIGDHFRLPDLMTSTGARIREVGTTNRTNAADYAEALGPDTGCVVKVHPSNFRITGYTRGVEVAELATLPVPVIVDTGSGLLTPDPLLPDEPTVAGALAAGADVVTCSADKLLGGPQAGLIFGRADLVDRMRRHPLARALRCDKLTLAALEATVRGPRTPTWTALHADADQLAQRCRRIAAALGDAPADVVGLAGGREVAEVVLAEVVRADGAVGGGGAPELALPGWAVALPPGLAEPLRTGTPPVVGRLSGGRLLLDLRCVPESDDEPLVTAVRAAIAAVPA